MNQVSLYTTLSLPGVDFLFFNTQSALLATVSGTINSDGVWVGTVPPNLASGIYTVVGKSGSLTLGKEVIGWDNGKLIPSDSTMILELYRLMGLDPARPLYVDRTARTVLPEIVQTLDDNNLRTVVTRLP